MDKRQFSYMAGPIRILRELCLYCRSGVIAKLQAKFKLDPEVYRQITNACLRRRKARKKVAKGK
jgi:hypothetical protein